MRYRNAAAITFALVMSTSLFGCSHPEPSETAAVTDTTASEATAELTETEGLIGNDELGIHTYNVPIQVYGSDTDSIGTATVTLIYNSTVYTEKDSCLDNLSVVRCDLPSVTEDEIFNWCYSGFAREYDLAFSEELKSDGYTNYPGRRYFHGFDSQELIDAYGADRDAELRQRREYMYLLKLQEGTYLMLSYRVPDDAAPIENESQHYDKVAARASAELDFDENKLAKYLLSEVSSMLEHSEFVIDTESGYCRFYNDTGVAGSMILNAMSTDKWSVSSDAYVTEINDEKLEISVGGCRIHATSSDGVMVISTRGNDFRICYRVPDGTLTAVTEWMDDQAKASQAKLQEKHDAMLAFLPKGAVELTCYQKIFLLNDFLMCYRTENDRVAVWRAEEAGAAYSYVTLGEPDFEYDRAEVVSIAPGGGSGEYNIYIAYHSGENVRYFCHYGAGKEDRTQMFEIPERELNEYTGEFDPMPDYAIGKGYYYRFDHELDPNAEVVRIPLSRCEGIPASLSYGDTQISVIKYEGKIYAAVVAQGLCSPFYTVSEDEYAYESSILLEPFTDVLGKDGVRLYYAEGANAASNCYFTVTNGYPELLIQCGKSAIKAGDLLISQSGFFGNDAVIYSNVNGSIEKTDVGEWLRARFPNIGDVYVSYRPKLFYEGHRGLFLIDLIHSDADLVGWIENGELAVIPENEMVIPEYKYVPGVYTTDEEGRKWLLERFDTDFALRGETDPTRLGEAELEEYMSEAYQAAQTVLFTYKVDTGYLLNGDYYSSAESGIYYCKGMWYEDCMNPAFKSLSDWESYLRRIFSAEIADRLMDNKSFAEVDGKLYVVPAARGTSPAISDVGSEITAVTDTDITYVRYIEIRDFETDETESASHEFHYSKTEDGWRWTEIYFYQ